MQIIFSEGKQVEKFLAVERRAIRKVLDMHATLAKLHGEEKAWEILRKAGE